MQPAEQHAHPTPERGRDGINAPRGRTAGRRNAAPRRRRQASSARLFLALLGCAVLAAIQLPVAGVPDVLDPPGRLWSLWPQTITWVVLGGIWLAGARSIYRALERATHRAEVFEGASPPPSLMEDHRHVAAALWFGVAAVLCAVILPPMLVGQWTLQPVQMWQGLYGTYGMTGIVAAVGLLAYHCGFAVLTALALATTQSAAESLTSSQVLSKIPVGGLLVGLVAAAYQSVTGGWPLFVTTLISFLLVGAVHLLTGRRLRWTAPATALVLVFL
ncbi:hypothetical protein [Kocuria sp.]|uniref:hypothetical protein n=1 Tax=Kocuria sp. TaxID=1871328 RepID=UPI0026DFC2A7|nr:hypothetical protein [Kocuria sp.]MDO5619503.1 hypothetical protein [Kocuria sp.]